MAARPVNVKSIDLTVDHAGAKPDIFFGERAIVHLTRGFDKTAAKTTTNLRQAITGVAWSATANLVLDTNNLADINQFDFGFIQILSTSVFVLEFSGKSRQLGAVQIRVPALENKIWLDSEVAITPWTRDPASRQTIVGSDLQCTASDHPCFMLDKSVQNLSPDYKGSSSITNLLRVVVLHEDFLTVLTQFDKAAFSVKALASFRWSIDFAFQMTYAKGVPRVQNISALNFDPVIIGEPNFGDGERQIFRNRSGNFFNAVAGHELFNAVQPGATARKDQAEWFLDTPANFFV